ncbi:MAG: hypothetical protein ACPLKP_03240 [Microgenomates group bacterium]
MNWPENYCPFRITPETIQFGNPLSVPKKEIPSQGICAVSDTRRESCLYPFGSDCCPLRRNQDFCNKPWASGGG